MKCNTCEQHKPEKDFSWKISGVKRSRKCKPCSREYARQHYLNNKQQYLKSAKKHANPERDRARKYGLTVGEREELFGLYGGKCHLCRDNIAEVVDHDHKCCASGKSCGKCVRGALCQNCNLGLGQFGDSVDRLNKAIDYISKPA